MKRSFIPVLLSALITGPAALAHEGMWLPTLLQAIEGDMRTEGLLIGAEDIYSINHGSLKDATVLFGGGCTAEVISTQGLILTNHHCGFSAIQQHSSLEHDYLKDGFWAATLADELPNPSLTATFIVRMEDVSDRVLAALTAGMTEAERRDAVGKVGDAIAKEATAGTGYSGVVRAFNYGNSYYLIVSETFRDVRLVGAPPGAIGKFGGDTDNWMWPRHTGDFSLFRIYMGTDGKPADFALTNVPYAPKRSLAINMDGVQAGDFDMIYGFPGSTQRYLSSYAVDYVMNVSDPLRIRMREASLNVIDAAMRASDRTRIQYASKQSGISNSYKKWIGEVRGLKELQATDRKRVLEEEYVKRSAGQAPYAQVLDELKGLYAAYTPYAKARDLFTEFMYVGPEVLRFADNFSKLVTTHEQLAQGGKLQEELDRLKRSSEGFFKNYDATVDRNVFKAQLPIYRANVDAALAPDALREVDTKHAGSTDAYTDALYAKTVFADEARVRELLDHFSAKAAKKITADPAYRLSQAFIQSFQEKVRPKQAELGERIEVGMRSYVKGLMTLFPERTWWPDANSTLRLSYGRVEGSDPRDGVTYKPFTTLSGILEKYRPDDPEFDVPKKLRDLYAAKDFGPYGQGDDIRVCFTSSLHTTGGNSGSPVFNGRGELVGLNFDRTWESTMSDILFDPAKCRNIAVDIRYVLFVIDKVCGARRLIEEMQLVSHAADPHVIPLPIHR
ncbi:MAG: S46 family peptidase [Bacteroidetes bacterium]|nr:S46 family peptidase [Bacteroidota bacterium]